MTTICSAPVETINTGIELTDFGVTDAKGRKVGAGVKFTTQVMEARTEGGGGYAGVKPGTYLSAWGFATRAGKQFGAITGSFFRFRIENTPDGEQRAMIARDAWVAEYLRKAKARAVKNFGT